MDPRLGAGAGPILGGVRGDDGEGDYGYDTEYFIHDYFPFREADGVVRFHQVLRQRSEKPSQEGQAVGVVGIFWGERRSFHGGSEVKRGPRRSFAATSL